MPTPTSLQITPSSLNLAVGKTQQLTATVFYDDATTADVTASCTWESSDSAVLGVIGGLVTAVAAGSATISASYTESAAAVKTTVATDDFNRANGTLTGGNWVKPSSYSYAVDLVGQRLRTPQAWSGHKAGANWATPMSSSSQWAEIRYSTPQDGYNTSGYKGVKVRSNEAGNTYYFACLDNTEARVIYIGKVVSGVETQITNAANISVNPGDTFGLQVVGNQLTALKNGAQTANVKTDASITAGDYIGIHFEGSIGNTNYCYFDDFAGGDWRGTTATVTANVAASAHVPIPRFRLNGPFESSLKSTEAISQLLGTFGGLLTWSQGQWVMSFAALKEPVLDLDDSDARGPMQVQGAVSLRDKCNAVKGVYISPDNEWQPSDFPAYINPKYVAEDSGKYGTTNKGKWLTSTLYHVNDAVVNGSNCWVCKLEHTSDAAKEPGNGADTATYWDAVTNILWRDVRLPFTLSASEAQRLAKYECVRSRQRGLKYIAGPRAYAVRPGEIITVTHTRFGWDKKRFEVVSTALEIVDGGDSGPELHVPLVLREDDPEGYGWIKTVEERDPTPPGPITVTIPT